jgi:hypothetical protein
MYLFKNLGLGENIYKIITPKPIIIENPIFLV